MLARRRRRDWRTALMSLSSRFDCLKQPPDIFERVRVLSALVRAPAEHAWKADGDAGTMSGGSGDAFEAELEDVDRLDVAHRPEALERMPSNPAIHLGDLLVRQAGIGLRDRHELAFVPDAEGVVGQQAGALAAARLRVDEHGVDRVGLDLPFPPVAALPADRVSRGRALEHESFDAAVARFAALCGEVFPAHG